MNKLLQFLSSHRLVYHRTHPLFRTAIFAALAFCTVAVFAIRFNQWEKERELALLKQQVAQLQQENAQLEQNINLLGTEESYRRLAAELLGLVDPETIVFDAE